jgi:hypothetical protein
MQKIKKPSLRMAPDSGLEVPGLEVPGFRVPGFRVPGFRVPGFKVPNFLGFYANFSFIVPLNCSSSRRP